MRPVLWILVSGLFVAFHCLESFAATPQRKVVIGHAALNARVAPLWIAEDLGFFVKHGVTANSIFIRQAPILVAALTAGDVHAAYTGGTTVLTAVTGGADLKTIATLTNRLGYDVVAAPSIKTAKDLRGKKVGVQTLAGTVWMGRHARARASGAGARTRQDHVSRHWRSDGGDPGARSRPD